MVHWRHGPASYTSWDPGVLRDWGSGGQEEKEVEVEPDNTRENGLRISCTHPFLPPKTMLLRQWPGQSVLTLFDHTLLPLKGCVQPPEHTAEIPLDRCWGIVFLTGTQAFLMQMILCEALLPRHFTEPSSSWKNTLWISLWCLVLGKVTFSTCTLSLSLTALSHPKVPMDSFSSL